MSKDGDGAEEALFSGEQELRLLVETIPTLVWRAGPEGNIEYVNKRVLEYFGAPLGEIIGWGWAERVPPGRRRLQGEDLAQRISNPEILTMCLQISRSGRPISVVQCTRRTTEGQRRPCAPLVRRPDRH